MMLLSPGILRLWAKTGWRGASLYQAVERASLSGRTTRTLCNSVTIELDLADHLQRHIYCFGTYEPVEMFLFRQLVRPDMCVFDIGANIGIYTLFSQDLAREVHAFEPIPKLKASLDKTLEKNGIHNVIVNAEALWSEPTSLTLRRGTEDKDNLGAFTAGSKDLEIEAISCLTSTVDEYTKSRQIERVHLMKIDCEGAEPHILQGARDTIARDQPILFFEMIPEALDKLGFSVDQLQSLLPDYRFWKIEDKPNTCTSYNSLPTKPGNYLGVSDPSFSFPKRWNLGSILRYFA